MIREVTFATPAGTEILSGNKLARMHWRSQSTRAKKQRRLIVVMILDSFARRPCRVFLPDGRPNRFTVTFTRITIRGTGLEQHDNLREGFKMAVDAASAAIWRGQGALAALNDPTGAAWKSIAGRDDGRACFEWLYQDQRSSDLIGIRIRIEDLEDGEPMIVLKDPPRLLGQAAAVGRPGKPVPLATGQQQMLFRPAWLALPWHQRDPNADSYENLVQATELSRLLDAPPHIEVKSPLQERVRLYRHDHSDPDLGGRVWLYCDQKPAGVTAAENTRAR